MEIFKISIRILRAWFIVDQHTFIVDQFIVEQLINF